MKLEKHVEYIPYCSWMLGRQDGGRKGGKKFPFVLEKPQNFLWGFIVVISKVKCLQEYFFMEITSNHHKSRGSGLCGLVLENNTKTILEIMPAHGSISSKKENVCFWVWVDIHWSRSVFYTWGKQYIDTTFFVFFWTNRPQFMHWISRYENRFVSLLHVKCWLTCQRQFIG